VDAVAAAAGLSVRTLQRLFAEHVGVSPKTVIRRYRIYEAAERARAGARVDWATLAPELGYSDQAHLVRDFTAAFGMPPERYARQERR
jgi:AraC-like DNA-binding protein